MKQIVFISGKGGTGKSTIAASLSLIVENKVMADCDVDAPNLHLLLHSKRLKEANYYGALQAEIDPALCISCGLCKDTCRFDAITGSADKPVRSQMQVIPLKCEGCGACVLVCPVKAIRLSEVKTGETYVDSSMYGTFSHALLDIGAEGTGKLVTEVKRNMFVSIDGEEWALIDGSPGIGCSVIASITGTDAAVIVCEPTKSGISDLDRILRVTKHFGIPAFVCINKYDLNLILTEEIEIYCRDNNIPVIGRIPYEPAVVKALQVLKTPVEAEIKNVADEIWKIWEELIDQLKLINDRHQIQ